MAHPLANQTEVRLRDLKEERWITIREEEIPGFKILLLQVLKPAQFTPKLGRSARSFEGMLAFVGTGEGVALLPELFLPPSRRGSVTSAPTALSGRFAPFGRRITPTPMCLPISRYCREKSRQPQWAPATSKQVPGRSVQQTRIARSK